jgi:hypothetical protein
MQNVKQMMHNVNWSDRSVKVDLTKDTIKNGPEYNPVHALTREFEDSLYSSYGKTGYWI